MSVATIVRYFLTYRGVSLPLNFTEELPADALRHRNTYFRAFYDVHGQMLICEKMVYGEVEMRHEYAYDAAGQLASATLTLGNEEPRVLQMA